MILLLPLQTVALFGLGGPAAASGKYPILADEEIMKPKAHGTSEKPVMKNLKWGADFEVSPHICLAAIACCAIRSAVVSVCPYACR